MTTPGWLAPAVKELEQERRVLVARLDALDLALMNLKAIWPDPITAPLRPRVSTKKTPVAPEERRDLLLAALAHAPHGMTSADLRKVAPEMDSKARSNALHRLRLAGKIRRVGNTWQHRGDSESSSSLVLKRRVEVSC